MRICASESLRRAPSRKALSCATGVGCRASSAGLLAAAGQRHANEVGRFRRGVPGRRLLRQPRRHCRHVGVGEPAGNPLHAVRSAACRSPDSPVRELADDAGGAQTDNTRNAGLHSGQARAVTRDTGRNALLRITRSDERAAARQDVRCGVCDFLGRERRTLLRELRCNLAQVIVGHVRHQVVHRRVAPGAVAPRSARARRARAAAQAGAAPAAEHVSKRSWPAPWPASLSKTGDSVGAARQCRAEREDSATASLAAAPWPQNKTPTRMSGRSGLVARARFELATFGL